MAVACAKFGMLDEKLFEVLAQAARLRVSQLTAQELANVVWAFATLGFSDEKMLAAVAREVQRRSCSGVFSTQNIANTAWSFATLSQLDQRLFAALATTARLVVDEFTAQGVANTVWAFAMLGQMD
eukprot:gnl/TRDRNA2_/TRDRNA2_147154_c0_seq2.p2 gnl/TRDRNA2_/TRDRNA2_147154_c0~~gnl/TRDRNA2_/TRDRNA2_147154_c0_seq2.p2  ORF type:complete len:126 (+),score=23.64 gnl/TRDRNA2_/TRDRNA2_147154_c0_seq2:449-826(+)